MILIALTVALVAAAGADDCHVWNTDVWYGDIYSFFARDFADCKERCRTNGGCRAVVYYHNGLSARKCFLKNGSHGGRIHCAWCWAAFKPCIDQEGPCPAGQYKNTPRSCATCPAGTYSAAGASSCSNCPAGRFSSAGSASCAACPAGTFSSVRSGDCGECPENTYSLEASPSCLECPNNSTSPAGSTSDADCSPVNGAHCWEEYDNVRMLERYGDALEYDAANDACFEDQECSGVSCRRRRRKDECYLSRGEEHEEERDAWYVHLKMKDCYGG